MPSQQFSTNYSGRKIDLLIFQGTQPAGDQKLTLAFGDAGEITTGIQKLAQMFTTLFLTERGSINSEPTRGTEFVTAVRRSRIRDESSLNSEFVMAAEAVRKFLALIEDEGGVPDDETFQSAVLDRFTLDEDAGQLTMFVRITSAAGSSRIVFLPIPVPIR